MFVLFSMRLFPLYAGTALMGRKTIAPISHRSPVLWNLGLPFRSTSTQRPCEDDGQEPAPRTIRDPYFPQ